MATPEPTSVGGVRSLKALWETKNVDNSPSIERGRAQNDQPLNKDDRPLSKVRSNFVAIESSTPPRGTSANPVPDGALITNHDRRGSFSLSSADDAKTIESIHKTISQEEIKRETKLAITDVVPEEAVVTSATGTPRVLSPKTKPTPLRKPVERASPRTTSKSSKTPTQRLTPRSTVKPSTTKATKIDTPLTNSGHSRRSSTNPTTPSFSQDPTMPQYRPTTSSLKDSTSGNFGSRFTPSKKSRAAGMDILTSSGDIQTSPAGESPTTPRNGQRSTVSSRRGSSPTALPSNPKARGLESSADTIGLGLRSVADANSDSTTVKAAVTGATRTGSSRLSAVSKSQTEGRKSLKGAASTPNLRGSTVNRAKTNGTGLNGTSKAGKMNPAPASNNTKRSSTASNAVKTNPSTTLHSAKPPPQTNSISSRLMAPTASTTARTNKAPSQPLSQSSIRTSTGSIKEKQRNGYKNPVAKPMVDKDLKHTDRKKIEPRRAPDDGFLTRLMRPTASSASRAHAKGVID